MDPTQPDNENLHAGRGFSNSNREISLSVHSHPYVLGCELAVMSMIFCIPALTRTGEYKITILYQIAHLQISDTR
jgi:hypothetical protein